MLICPDCSAHLDVAARDCAGCGWRVQERDGFPHFDPALANENAGYDADHYRELFAIEESSFWFRSRNRLLLHALRELSVTDGAFLELGCGTGFVMRAIGAELPNLRMHGCEIFTEGLRFAAQRNPGATFFQADARRLPFEEAFDCIGAFDVLEHIEEDELVLRNLWRALRPGGGLLLTVPQHMFAWSAFDDIAHHERRYSRREMLRKLRAAGFEPLRATSFVSLLFPAMLASRLVHRLRRKEATVEDFKNGPWMDASMEAVMSVERFLITRLGRDLPAGGSLLVVAKKRRR